MKSQNTPGQKPTKSPKDKLPADAAFLKFAASLSEEGFIDLGGIFANRQQKADRASYSPDALLNSQQAAELMGISEKTLANWRVSGAGPRFVKVGGRVAYRNFDLESFVSANLKVSTSDSPQGGSNA